jgi:hypothetical protein
MTERPATRADLRVLHWNMFRNFPDDPRLVQCALAQIATLDADERDDPKATARVARMLEMVIVDTDPAGRLVGFHTAPSAPLPRL